MNNKEMKEHKIIRAVPLDVRCFATHDGPSEGVGMHTYITEDNYVVGLCRTKECHQGYPGNIHGGIIATYFDEVLWYATTVSDAKLVSMTIEMNVKYLKSLPTGENIRIVAKPMRRDGRHLYVDGYILREDDEIAAEATAHFLVLKPNHKINDSNIYATLVTEDADLPDKVRF